jgi:hypothetical protein
MRTNFTYAPGSGTVPMNSYPPTDNSYPPTDFPQPRSIHWVAGGGKLTVTIVLGDGQTETLNGSPSAGLPDNSYPPTDFPPNRVTWRCDSGTLKMDVTRPTGVVDHLSADLSALAYTLD